MKYRRDRNTYAIRTWSAVCFRPNPIAFAQFRAIFVSIGLEWELVNIELWMETLSLKVKFEGWMC